MDPRLLRRYAKVMLVSHHPWFYRMSGDRKDTGLIGYYQPEVASKGLMLAVDVDGVLPGDAGIDATELDPRDLFNVSCPRESSPPPFRDRCPREASGHRDRDSGSQG